MPRPPAVVGVVFAGVGGQGVASAAEVLALAAIDRGLCAVVLETRGLAQRGGMITAHVRVGASDAVAPRSSLNDVHFLVGFEPAETARSARAFPRARVLSVGSPLLPGGLLPSAYPSASSLRRELEARPAQVLIVDTPKSIRVNIFGLGALAALGAAGADWATVEAVARRRFSREDMNDLAAGHAAIEQLQLVAAWNDQLSFEELDATRRPP